VAQDLYQYDKMVKRAVERAFRDVAREILARVAQEGPPGAHHFYIGFATQAPGVVIPEHLRDRYPEEMTIVLQHRFWDLEVGEEAFSVSLSFQKQLERLTIPFAAIRSFADPSVNFMLEFAGPPAPQDTTKLPAAAPAQPASREEAKADTEPKPTGEVVSIDRFRKR